MPDNAPNPKINLPRLREACLICHEESPLSELVALGCAHIYHPECITRWWEISLPKECPYCKQKARSFGHACGQPGACSVSSVPDTPNPFLPGPLPVCLPCEVCGQLYSLLDAKRILKLIDSLYCNQLSLRSLLSLYDGTDLYDYDQWRERDRKEMEETGNFHYCQRNRPTTAAANVVVYLDNGRRRVYREQPEETTTEASSYQHHLRYLGRVTRAELAYACDTEDFLHLSVAVASRSGAGYTEWHQTELPNLRARRGACTAMGISPCSRPRCRTLNGSSPSSACGTVPGHWISSGRWPRWSRRRIRGGGEGEEENNSNKKEEDLQRELDDLATEYSWRMACLVHVRDVITARVKQDKRGEEFQQLM
ncbi:hypothetical protein PG984_000959 [Apiospora sp. TS-2023a]